MGRTTLTGRGWVRRLVVGTAAAASLALVAPGGGAAAAPTAGQQQGSAQGSGQDSGSGGGQGQGQGSGSGSQGSSGQGSGGQSGGQSGGGQSGGGSEGNQSGQNAAQQAAQRARQQAAQQRAEQQQQAAQQKSEQQAAAKAAQEQAEAEAKARQKAAEAAAKERARAAKRAAQLAAATQRARQSWDSHARPEKLAIVRSRTIDLVTNGSLTRQVPRRQSTVTISELDRYLPTNWLTVADGTATLSAAVVLSPGVVMEIGGDVKEVKLTGGDKPSQASSIYSGSGKLRVHDVTIGSVDPGSGQPLAVSPGRPFIVVSSNGQLDMANATINDLGTPADAADRPGLLFGINSAGSVVNSTFQRNSTGIKLDRSNAIKLENVTVSDSTADGLVLRGDKGTSLVGIKANTNKASGVLVTGESTDRPITGISTSGNGGFGVAVVRQLKPRINGIVTDGDGAGGVRVSRSDEAVVTDITTTNEPIGVLVHAGATKAALDQLRISGGKRGVVVDKSVTEVNLRGSTIEGAGVVAVGVAGKHVTVNDVAVRDSATGVRMERGSADLGITNLTVTGGKDGVISTPGTNDLTLQNLATDGVSSTAVRTFTPDAKIEGGRIVGSTTGIDTGAATAITGTTITQVDTGIRARSTDPVTADNVDINAVTAGITVADGSPFQLTASRVDALEAVHGVVQQRPGDNELSLPPLNLLGAIGVPLILLALVLEQINAFRQRGVGNVRRRQPPALPAAGVG